MGFLDDDPSKLGKAIYDNFVLGGLDDLERIHAQKPFDAIVLSTIPRHEQRRQDLSRRARALGVELLEFQPQFTALTGDDLRSAHRSTPGRQPATAWAGPPSGASPGEAVLDDLDSSMDSSCFDSDFCPDPPEQMISLGDQDEVRRGR